MKIFIATDHAGFELKNALIRHITEQGHNVVDMGAMTLDNNDDYPAIMRPVAEAVLAATQGAIGDSTARGIVIGGSGNGEAITTNRYKGIRAAVYYGYNLDIIKLSRQHNDANILSLGARFLSIEQGIEAVDLWLATPFSNEERHIRRIKAIDTL